MSHSKILTDFSEVTNKQLINSIFEFEQHHLPNTNTVPKPFSCNNQASTVWESRDFSTISYKLPDEMPFKDSIPFVCDYLRMNNSLKRLADKLNLKLCSTDIIILILKYSSFNARLFIMEQLCMYHRAIPIYFGVPIREDLSMTYCFLMQEMLQMFLPYSYQKIPLIISFGTVLSKGKTLLLNKILQTNFDCHSKSQLNIEIASDYYHNQLIQMVFGHWYDTDRDINNKVERNYYCHVLDLHGNHNWNTMPCFFIEFTSVIIIHMDVEDSDDIDKFAWPSITFHQTATYLIFIYGQISESDMKTKFELKIQKYFDSNKINVYFFQGNAILHENNKSLQSEVLRLLKQAPTPRKSLLDISQQSIEQYNIKLSTNVNILAKTKKLLDDFHTILNTLSLDDSYPQLFPLSQLKELSDKTDLLSKEKEQQQQLAKSLYEHSFNRAHVLLTTLAELAIVDDNDIVPFEKAVLLWNVAFRERKQNAIQRSPISSLDQLAMNKERFLREFQERSVPYKDRNDRYHSFEDNAQIKKALVNIYQRSFRSQEHIELINATSITTYLKIFDDTFCNNPDDLKKFFVIGIIGEQSQGKSFLMNKAFGTKTAESILKCTTGILATRLNITGHETVKNIIALDTEGLLDASKKDITQIFDRKMVFTVMARSHIVMINITGNVNSMMQNILEIVFYGLNKLNITNKPRLIFLFRDQNNSRIRGNEHWLQVNSVMENIKKSFKQVELVVENIRDDFDIHEFSSPFLHHVADERKLTYFDNSFCQEALSLRMKVIDHLANLKPFNSFNEWTELTLQCWEQISFNSNLFDFESVVQLTLEKELEAFCNQELTKVDSDMGTYIDNTLKNYTLNDINVKKIESKLDDMKKDAKKEIDQKLDEEKSRLMANYKLRLFEETLLEKTKARINSSLDLYKTYHGMILNRYLTQDEFQKKLLKTVKELSDKTKQITGVSEDEFQFETSFNNTSKALLEDFIKWLDNDYKKESDSHKKQLLYEFIRQNKIDKAGVQILPKDMNNSSLHSIIKDTVLGENPRSEEEQQRHTTYQPIVSTNQHGCGVLRNPAAFIDQQFTYEKKHNEEKVQLLEQMLLFLQREYKILKQLYNDNSTLLPVLKLCNDCVEGIPKNLKICNVKDQDTINIWYTCYAVMLTIFCNEHYKYVRNKLITKFKEEISHTKEEVKENIAKYSKAKEHGQLLTVEIWQIIQKKIQERFQEDFERSVTGWNNYRPSIISENCVNQLFKSNKYQEMFNYIQNPSTYIKHWLRSEFARKYELELNQKIFDFSLNLEENKKKFARMISDWHTAVQLPNVSDSLLIDTLKTYLLCGEYTGNNISLTESAKGFQFLEINEITTVTSVLDKHSFLKSISSASASLLAANNDSIVQSTRNWINNDQLKNRLFDQFYDKAKGCGIPCPYCKQICDNGDPVHKEHRTEHHLLWVFAGYRYKFTGKPCLNCCTSNQAFIEGIESLTEKDNFILFTEHIQRFNPTWKIINQKTPLQDFQEKVYIALEEDLAKYYKFKGRADISIKKKHLRYIVTNQCYGLLVGIDYEDTQNTLYGTPSCDVSSIADQLNVSSIGYKENLHVLKNSQASKDNILTKLKSIINNMDQRASFIFYFSGYGRRVSTSESYLLTSDNQQLTTNELAAAVAAAKTNKIIIILDSYYSDDMNNSFQFDSKSSPQGIHILCASRQNQKTRKSDSDRNGFFTKYLIKGLKGEFTCGINNCNECRTRTENLQRASIHKVTSAELETYLKHTVSRCQNFTYMAINGSDFDISFLD